MVTAERLQNIHSLQLALDAEFHFVRSLKDLLQTHDVVGVGVSEGDVVWKAADFDGFRTAADELVGNHNGAVQAQSFTWTWRRATRLGERDESMRPGVRPLLHGHFSNSSSASEGQGWVSGLSGLLVRSSITLTNVHQRAFSRTSSWWINVAVTIRSEQHNTV